jgi:hypothetical protein
MGVKVVAEAHVTLGRPSSYAELNAILGRARSDGGHNVPVTSAQLLGLQRRWTAALSARLDEAIEVARPGEEVEIVAAAWHTLAHDLNTLRAVLAAHEVDSQALAAAQRAEFRMLALAAGLATLDAPVAHVVDVGQRLREWIRSSAEASELMEKYVDATGRHGACSAQAADVLGAGERHGVPIFMNSESAVRPEDRHHGKADISRHMLGCWVGAWRMRRAICHAR